MSSTPITSLERPEVQSFEDEDHRECCLNMSASDHTCLAQDQTDEARTSNNASNLCSAGIIKRPALPGSRSIRAKMYLSQPAHGRPYKTRRRSYLCSLPTLFSIFTFVTLLLPHSQAAFINFDNCLDPGIVNSNPVQLQWIPLWLDANFNTTSASHRLNITIYGNVSGQAYAGPYPPPSDPSWNDTESTFGKILNFSTPNDKYSTLFAKYNVLTYTPYDAPATAFCDSTVNTSCPIGPAFFANRSDPYALPAFSVGHDFFSAYSFASFQATIRVQSGDAGAPDLACVSAIVTPDLGNAIEAVLNYLPVVILACVAVATLSAAIGSPWGSTDPFRWTSNYGRDEDLLRLITPGFGDCLQYIQFIVLAGSLSLSYPGYYQPAVSCVGWSALMFNESFVSHGSGTQNPKDGIYVTNGTYGLDRMSQLVGMTEVKDIWAGMAIWTLVIVAATIVLCQLGFLLRWASRRMKKTPEQDLRRKNWPFTAGNMARIVCNYFLLPIVALSMFQLVVATSGPIALPILAAVLLIAIICFAVWILRLIVTTKPRSLLFEDLPTVLLYGPLYNTYSDDAASFALIPALVTFVRGVAIGAVQPSGIAQLVILAICEITLILTLYAFRPFHSPTSMNAYHTFFAAVRLATVLLSVAFVPSLGVTEAPKGWIGYVILLLHAIVLVFGFLLNAIQTLIEIIARRAGAGGDDQAGAVTRGGLVKVFGMRQLSRRAKRPGFRSSLNSEAAILPLDDDFKSGERSRSMSASSAILLNQRGTSDSRLSGHMDRVSSVEDADTPREHKSFSFLPGESSTRPTLGLKAVELQDPYYRPPRPRRATGDMPTPGAKSRGSWSSAELLNRPYEDSAEQPDASGASRSFSPIHGAPVPAYLRTQGPDSDAGANDPRHANVDYAVREVDFYYGVRGPALSNQPTRKLKTGPADPVGPVSSATGWFKGMFKGKTKDKGKGFEVVRSSRAPQGFDVEDEEAAPPYHDSPEPQPELILPGQRTRSTDLDRSGLFDDDSRPVSGESRGAPSPLNSDDERELDRAKFKNKKSGPVTDRPPSLDPIDTVGGIELPSRFGSKASSRRPRADSDASGPTIPRKSSKRNSAGDIFYDSNPRLSTVEDSPNPTPQRRRSSGIFPQGFSLDDPLAGPDDVEQAPKSRKWPLL